MPIRTPKISTFASCTQSDILCYHGTSDKQIILLSELQEDLPGWRSRSRCIESAGKSPVICQKGFSKFPGISARLVRFHWFYFSICLRQVGGDQTPDFWSRFELQEHPANMPMSCFARVSAGSHITEHNKQVHKVQPH